MKLKYLLMIFILSGCKMESSIVNDIAKKDKILLDSANLFYNTGQYEKAVIYYDRLINLDSTNGLVYFRRGYSNAQINNFESSISDYLKAIDFKVFPKDTYFNIGCDYAAMFNNTMALYYFEKAYEIDPKDDKIKKRIIEIKNR